MEIKRSTIYIGVILLVLISGGFFFLNGENSVTNGNVVSAGVQVLQDEKQIVIISQDGFNYKDAIIKADKPIILSADNSVSGCLRSVVFNIDGKKYSKYLKSPDDTLELPALTKGTYNFACSMGMGLGKLIVN